MEVATMCIGGQNREYQDYRCLMEEENDEDDSDICEYKLEQRLKDAGDPSAKIRYVD